MTTAIESKIDIEYARFSEKKIFNHSTRESQVEKYSDRLVVEYEKYAKSIVDTYQEDLKEYRHKMESHKKMQCICGHPMRFVKDFDFWGCVDYRNKSVKHVTYQSTKVEYYPPKYHVRLGWLPEIITAAGLKGIVKAKEFYQWLIENGYEDLRMVFEHRSSESTFSGYIKANKNSKSQEKECLDYLRSRYPKVTYQQSITYKLSGSKESFCIPDFICSDPNKIMVVDAKLDFPDDDKMDLYVALVRHIAKLKKDERWVMGAHIMYVRDVSALVKSKYPLFKI